MKRGSLPPGFPADVAAFACDLDGTLVGRDATLHERTLNAITRARAAGIPSIVATGRMFRSVLPYLEQAGIVEPVVCYQGAAVVDPGTGAFLVHRPIGLDLARRTIAVLAEHGYSPNVYVDDRLFVAEHNDHSRAYAGFQHLEVTAVGDLLAWLSRPPTKLVVVGDPAELETLREATATPLGDALYVTTSLPHFLEFGVAGVSKGSGLADVCNRLGIDLARVVAFGDGENDVELLQATGFAVAVESAHPRLLAIADATCQGPNEQGVAQVVEAYLDSAP